MHTKRNYYWNKPAFTGRLNVCPYIVFSLTPFCKPIFPQGKNLNVTQTQSVFRNLCSLGNLLHPSRIFFVRARAMSYYNRNFALRFSAQALNTTDQHIIHFISICQTIFTDKELQTCLYLPKTHGHKHVRLRCFICLFFIRGTFLYTKYLLCSLAPTFTRHEHPNNANVLHSARLKSLNRLLDASRISHTKSYLDWVFISDVIRCLFNGSIPLCCTPVRHQ